MFGRQDLTACVGWLGIHIKTAPKSVSALIRTNCAPYLIYAALDRPSAPSATRLLDHWHTSTFSVSALQTHFLSHLALWLRHYSVSQSRSAPTYFSSSSTCLWHTDATVLDYIVNAKLGESERRNLWLVCIPLIHRMNPSELELSIPISGKSLLFLPTCSMYFVSEARATQACTITSRWQVNLMWHPCAWSRLA